MEIGIDQAPTKSTRRRTILIVLIIIIAAVLCGYFYTQYDFSRKIHQKPWFFERPSVDTSDTEISIFVFGDSYIHFDPDLRGRFWEHQIQEIGKNISVQYIANTRNIAGFNWTVPESLKFTAADPGSCEKNIESWKLFSLSGRPKRWYFKADQDTYINLPQLLTLISELDKKIDPFTTPYFQYALTEAPDTGAMVFPHASSGWLISHAAVRILFSHMHHFSHVCSKLGEEIAFGQMILDMKYDVEDFYNPRFIPEWPAQAASILGTNGDQLKATAQIADCPSKQFRFNLHLNLPFERPAHFISTKFKNVPMDNVPPLVEDINYDLLIGHITDDKPVFCWDN